MLLTSINFRVFLSNPSPMNFPTINATSAPCVGAGTPSIPGITVNNTLGAVFIGYSFAWMIFGIVTTQVINYYQRFTADSPVVKTLVSVIEFLFHRGGSIHTRFQVGVIWYGCKLQWPSR